MRRFFFQMLSKLEIYGRGKSLVLGRRGESFSYDAGAGGGSHLADEEAPGKAFEYGTGAGGRSHLAKLRDGAQHCNSLLSLSFLLKFFQERLRRLGAPPQRNSQQNQRLSALLQCRAPSRSLAKCERPPAPVPYASALPAPNAFSSSKCEPPPAPVLYEKALPRRQIGATSRGV